MKINQMTANASDWNSGIAYVYSFVGLILYILLEDIYHGVVLVNHIHYILYTPGGPLII